MSEDLRLELESVRNALYREIQSSIDGMSFLLGRIDLLRGVIDGLKEQREAYLAARTPRPAKDVAPAQVTAHEASGGLWATPTGVAWLRVRDAVVQVQSDDGTWWLNAHMSGWSGTCQPIRWTDKGIEAVPWDELE